MGVELQTEPLVLQTTTTQVNNVTETTTEYFTTTEMSGPNDRGIPTVHRVFSALPV